MLSTPSQKLADFLLASKLLVYLTQSRPRRWAIVNKVMNCEILWNALTTLQSTELPRTLLSWKQLHVGSTEAGLTDRYKLRVLWRSAVWYIHICVSNFLPAVLGRRVKPELQELSPPRQRQLVSWSSNWKSTTALWLAVCSRRCMHLVWEISDSTVGKSTVFP